jgi:hypothetical protein
MIDPKLFTVERLIAAMLHTSYGNINQWWLLAEIVSEQAGENAPPAKPRWVVRIKSADSKDYSYLRYSNGPAQGHFWDMYGDDYLAPEHALLALMSAPIPPIFIDRKVFREAVNVHYAQKEIK